MKIKIIIGERNLRLGGTQRLAVDLLRLLDKKIFDVYLISLVQWPDRGDFYNLVPPEVHVFKLNFKSWHHIREWVKLIRILRKIKPDVVKSSGFYGNSIFRILQPLFGYKAIASEHNTHIKRSKVQTLINRILNVFTYTTIGVSNMVVEELAASGGFSKNKLTVIHNGVDLSAVKKSKQEYYQQRNSIRGEFGIDRDAKVFLCVARFIKQKNHTLMIDAFKLVSERDPNCKLVLVGGGLYMQAAQEQVARLGLQDKVLIVGERKDVHRFYVMSDFFIMTSVHEGFSLAAMEGLAFGLPLISTKVSGTVEFLQDGKNGFFVEAEAKDIADKINIAARLSAEKLQQCKNFAEQTALQYGLEQYGKAHQELFMRAARS